MLALTRRTEYALIATCHLAHRQADIVSARDIAEQESVPLSLLMNVLKQLSQAGLVQSVRGVRGGYRLARPAARIRLTDVIEAVEGPMRLVRCIGSEETQTACCELESCCSIRTPVQRVHERLKEFLAAVSIADLAQEQRGPRAVLQLPRAIAQ